MAGFTFSHFFNSSMTGTEKFIEKIEELDGILVNSKFGITGRVIDKVKSEFDLYKYLGLRRLGNLIKKYPQATFYFLSPNEELNLEAVSVFKEIAKCKKKIESIIRFRFIAMRVRTTRTRSWKYVMG